MTKRQSNRLGNQHQREDETGGCSSSALLGTSSPYALHQDDAERQQQRQAQHEDESLTASATPSPFDYSEFSRYVVSSTPGNMTPNGRALKQQQQPRGSFSSAASLLSSNSLSGGAPFKKERASCLDICRGAELYHCLSFSPVAFRYSWPSIAARALQSNDPNE